MGYNEDGVWLGDCPSFELDTESCCVSLNMCPAARHAGSLGDTQPNQRHVTHLAPSVTTQHPILVIP